MSYEYHESNGEGISIGGFSSKTYTSLKETESF